MSVSYGLAQTGWSVEDDSKILENARAHTVRFFDAVPTKYPPNAFEEAVGSWRDAGVEVRSTQGFFFKKEVTVCACKSHMPHLRRVFEASLRDAKVATAKFMILGAPASRVLACNEKSFIKAILELGELASAVSVELLLENLPYEHKQLPFAAFGDMNRIAHYGSVGLCLDLGNLASWPSSKHGLSLNRELQEIETISHLQVNCDLISPANRQELSALLQELPNQLLLKAGNSVSLEFPLNQIKWDLLPS